MLHTPDRDGRGRSALGDLSPNVVRSKSPKRSTQTKVLGKMLGEMASNDIENSHKSTKCAVDSAEVFIEARPSEVKAARELSLSPVKKTYVGGAVSPVRSPRKTPKLKLSNTQTKLLGDSSNKTPRLNSKGSNSNLVTKQVKKTRNMTLSNEYEVIFPAGAMGLELEPVVISSVRKIGCRVRDFYFGLDYEGIDPKVLQKTIRIGDIISSVNGVSVLSSSFMDVLDILTSNREAKQRVLQFKDVSVASSNLTRTPVGSIEGREGETLTSHALDDIPSHPASGGSADNNGNMTPVKSSDAASNQATAPDTSPAAWKTYPATPDVFAPLSASTTPSVRQPSFPEEGLSLTISPKAVRALSKARALVSPDGQVGIAALLQRNVSPADLGQALGRVGASLRHSFKGVAHKILEPFDSFAHQKEAEAAMARKHELLAELSRSCVLLGQAEEKESDLQARLASVKEEESRHKESVVAAEEKVRQLTAQVVELEASVQAQDEVSDKAAAASSENKQLKKEIISLNQENNALRKEIEGWNAVVEENKRAFDASHTELEEVKVQLLAASEEVVVVKSAHQHEKNELIDKHDSDVAAKGARISDLETALELATTDKEEAVTQRDAAVAEMEFLKEMIDTEKKSVNGEVDRLKRHIEELQSAHKKELLTLTKEKEEVEVAARGSIKSLEEEAQALGVNLATALEEKTRAETLDHEARTLLKEQESRLKEVSAALDEAKTSLLKAKVNHHVHQYHGGKLDDALCEVRAARESDWADFQVAMAEKDGELKEMAEKLLEASSHAVDLDSQLRQLRKDRDELMASFKTTNESREHSFHSALVKSQKEQDALRGQKEEMSLKIAALEGSVTDQAAGLASTSGEVATLRREVSRLEEVNAEMQHLGEEYVEEAERTQATLQEEVNAATTTIEGLHDQITTMKVQHAEATEKLNVLLEETEAQLQQHEALWREEKEKCLILEDKTLALAEDLETAQFAYATRNIDCETLEQKVTELRSAIEQRDFAMNEFEMVKIRESEEKEVEIELSSVQKAQLRDALAQERSKQKKCVETANAACSELAWELKDIRNSVLDLGLLEKEYVSTLKMVESKYSVVVNDLETQLDTLKQESQEEVASLTAKLDNLSRDRDMLTVGIEEQAKDNDDKITTVFNRAREAEKLLETAYDEHEDLRKQISVIELQKAKALDRVSELDNEVIFYKESLEQAKVEQGKLEMACDEHKFAVVHLREECARITQLSEKGNEAMVALESRLSHSTEEHKLAVDEADALNALLHEVKAGHKKKEKAAQKTIDELLAAQRDLASEHHKQESHLKKTHADKIRTLLAEAEATLERVGQEFERKQSLLAEDHAVELDNMAKKVQKHAEMAESLKAEAEKLHTTLAETREEKKRVQNMMLQQDDALQLGEGRCVALKEEIESAEAEARKFKTELTELTDKLAAAAAREADLVKQRKEMMESLQSQQANLNSAIEERDTTIASMKGEYEALSKERDTTIAIMKSEYEALSKELTAFKEAHATTEAEAKDLTCTVANLQARLNNIEQHNESNMESNMKSQDVVKKLATTLNETKQLLTMSVDENRGLLEQRDELNQAFKAQKNMLEVVEKSKKQAEEKVVYLEKTVESAQADLASVNSRVDAMCKEHQLQEEELRAQVETLAQDAASNHTLALSAQQSLLAKQTELDALHRQCTELISAAVNSPEPSPHKHRDRRDIAEQKDEDEAELDKENTSSHQHRATALSGFAPPRQVLAPLATPGVESTHISDLSSSDGLVAAGLGLEEASKWHDHLLSLALDLHEAITFATAADYQAQEACGEVPQVSPPLRMASESLRSLHEHVVHAPWLDSAAIAPQSLPAAHEMMHALQGGHASPAETCTHIAAGQMQELNQAKETIALMEQRLNQLIDAKTSSPSSAVDAAASALHSVEFRRQDGLFLGVSQSETVYTLVEELKTHLESKFSFTDSDKCDADTSQDSFLMGGPSPLWRDLHSLTHDILSSYNNKLMAQAVSRGNSRDPSPRNVCSTEKGTAASTGSFLHLHDYARLSNESRDMPHIGASTESMASHLSVATAERQLSARLAEDTTLDQIVAMAERDMKGVDTSFDSLNSQETRLSMLKPVAKLPMQASLDEEGLEIENIHEEPELSCSKEEDSGFWNVSAASIDPCLSDADESFDILK